MKKLIKQIKEKTWIHYLIIFVIGLIIAIPLTKMEISQTHDGWVHLMRIVGIEKSLTDGAFPYLVAPYICRDFGYSMVALYPPIVAYIPYLIGLITVKFTSALKVFAAITISLSGIFMYNFINEVTHSKKTSFLAAIIYMTFPYHLETIFNRFAIGEFTAYVFIPLVFQGLYNLLHGDRKKYFYIIIGATGILLSHTISTVYTALFCAIYILFHTKDFFKKEVIIKCVICVVCILLLSAFFIVPLLEYRLQADYVIFDAKLMRSNGIFNSTETIKLNQLIKDEKEVTEEGGVSFIIGVPVLIMLGISVFAYPYIKERKRDLYNTFALMGVISVFMCTRFFPWVYMPQILCSIQFPWRLMGFMAFFLTPILAMNTYYVLNTIKSLKWKDVLYVATILAIIIYTLIRCFVFYPRVINPVTKDENEVLAREKPIVITHFGVARDYLTVNAIGKQLSYLLEREDRVYILSGKAQITNENKKALHMTFNVSGEEDTVLELPYFFYPGYEAMCESNGVQEKLNIIESDSGFLQITLPRKLEDAKIEINYTGTYIEKISYAVSGVFLIVFTVYVIIQMKRIRNGENNERQA